MMSKWDSNEIKLLILLAGSKGMTRQQLADKLFVNVRTLFRWEKEGVEPIAACKKQIAIVRKALCEKR